MLFGMWTRVRPRNHVMVGALGTILGASPGHCDVKISGNIIGWSKTHAIVGRATSASLTVRTSAVLVAQVGEAPDVAEPDTVADARQQELDRRRPLDALLVGDRRRRRPVDGRQRHGQLHVVHARLRRLGPPRRRPRVVLSGEVVGRDRVDVVAGPRRPQLTVAAAAQRHVLADRQHHLARPATGRRRHQTPTLRPRPTLRLPARRAPRR